MSDIAAAEQAAGLLISAARQINKPDQWTQNNATNMITEAARLTAVRTVVGIAAWLTRWVAGRAGSAWSGPNANNVDAEDDPRLACQWFAESRRAAIHAATVGDVSPSDELRMLAVVGLTERATETEPPPGHAVEHLLDDDLDEQGLIDLLKLQVQLLATLATFDGWRTLDALSLALRGDDTPLPHSSEQEKPL